MIEIPESRVVQAFESMKYTHEYITGVREQLTRYADYVHVDEHVLEYLMSSFKYMQDWLGSGMKELRPFVDEVNEGDDE